MEHMVATLTCKKLPTLKIRKKTVGKRMFVVKLEMDLGRKISSGTNDEFLYLACIQRHPVTYFLACFTGVTVLHMSLG